MASVAQLFPDAQDTRVPELPTPSLAPIATEAVAKRVGEYALKCEKVRARTQIVRAWIFLAGVFVVALAYIIVAFINDEEPSAANPVAAVTEASPEKPDLKEKHQEKKPEESKVAKQPGKVKKKKSRTR
jgi:hypothetical protein